jgi:peptide/histidine transporter 3/4
MDRIADSFLGRYTAILVFSFIYSIGLIMAAITAQPSLQYVNCSWLYLCTFVSLWLWIDNGNSATGFFFFCLYVIALGTGGIKPNAVTLGAEQFDEVHFARLKIQILLH